jgi:hypothetical protein
MSGNDHPPSTHGPARSSARRALWGSLAVVAVVVGPLGIASAQDGPTPAGADEVPTTAQDWEKAQQLRARTGTFAALADTEAVPAVVAPPTTQAPTTTTAPPPPPPPPPVQPVASGSGYNDPSNPAAWDRLAQCESGGSWAINTGNGYYGGLQFSLSSWQAVGGTGYPHEHSRETQIAMGQRLWNQGGWAHWPACSSKLGYR